MTGVRVVSLVFLVVIAGCLGIGPSNVTDWTAPDTPKPAEESSQRVGPQATATPPLNPWRAERIVVATETDGSRNLTRMVRAAITYWHNRMEYAAYPVTFVLAPDASDPDILVTFTADIQCKDHTDEDTLGCAPVLRQESTADRPVHVRVKPGYTDATTIHVITHEFGHVLGLTHGDPPTDIMDPQYNQSATLPAPNASERDYPWEATTLRVSVDPSNVSSSERGAFDTQVQRAVEYYHGGAAGHVPPNVSIHLTDNHSRADIHIVYVERDPCQTGTGSCVERWGGDPDRDGAIEYYERAEITLVDVDIPAVGWHVGYWFGFLFGAGSEAELPPPFVDADYTDRRSSWWD